MLMEFKLPDLGEGIHEGEIVEVLVAEGDKVEDGTLVLIVETDKATTEIPSPVAGVVKEIRVRPGDVVKVGQVMMVFEEAGKKVGGRAKGIPEDEPAAETGGAGPEKTVPGKEKEKEQEEAEADVSGAPSGVPVPAAPSTRRLARELGVDLKRVKPSGPGGRVMPEDVRAFAEKKAEVIAEPQKPREPYDAPADVKGAPAPPPTSEIPKAPQVAGEAPIPVQTSPPPTVDWDEPVERVPLRSIRKATARNMALAWSHIPHVTHQDAADITDLEAFRQKHKDKILAQGGALSLTVLVLKATVAALKAFPSFNAGIDLEAGEILLKKHYHLGVAVDTPRGLIVPVVRHVDRKSITELALELPELVRRTLDGKIDREELSGGTFTLTNIGALGGRAFTPIVNYPQAAILGLARARLEPVIRGDMNHYRVVPRLMLPLMLGFDHRVADGADAARFLNRIKDALQDPENLLMTI